MTTTINATCPYCGTVQAVNVREKDTVVCGHDTRRNGCFRPFEVYEDGRIEESAFNKVTDNTVNYTDGRSLCGPGGFTMKTNK